MMRLTRPASDEAGYPPFLLVGFVWLYVSEDADYHTSDGISGALLSGGAPTNDNRLEECIITNEKVTNILKRYYYMLFPKELKENEYVCLFLVKTDKDGNPVVDKDGREVHFHRYVKSFE